MRSLNVKVKKPLILSPITWQVIGPLVLFGKILIKGQVLFWGATYLQFTPWRVAAYNILKNGELPLWNTLNGFGAPLFANYQSALLYPPNILLLIGALIHSTEGIAIAQTVLVMVHLIVSGMGCVLLLKSLGMKPFTQTIGGILFALCGYQVSRVSFLSMNAALVWIPWLMYFSYQWISAWAEHNSTRRNRYILFHILATWCQLMAGHAQITWYTQIMISIWVILWMGQYRKKLHPKHVIMGFVLVVMLSVGLAMIQLLPTAEYLASSQRSQEVGYDYALNYSFWPWRYLSLLSPNLYGNPGTGNYWVKADNYWEDDVYISVAAVLLAVSTLIKFIFRHNTFSSQNKAIFSFSSGFIGAGVIFSLGWHTPIYPFLYRYIPTFNLFQGPARYGIWMEIGMILLACLGIERWNPPSGKLLYWSRLGLAGASAAIVTALLAKRVLSAQVQSSYVTGFLETAILLTIFFILNLFQPKSKLLRQRWQLITISAILGDLLFAGWMLNPGISLSVFSDLMVKQNQGNFIYLHTQDESTVKFGKFFMFDRFLPEQSWKSLPEFMIPDTNLYTGTASTINFDPFLPGKYPQFTQLLDQSSQQARDKFLPWLGVDTQEIVKSSEISQPEWKSYRAEQPYHFVACSKVGNASSDLSNMMAEMIADGSYRQNVLLETGDRQQEDCDHQPETSITLVTSKNNHQIIQIINQQPGWLVQLQTHYPGWIVLVDGKPSVLLRADINFRAVHLEAGEHTVEFVYRPQSFYLGASISVICWVILLAGYEFFRRRTENG